MPPRHQPPITPLKLPRSVRHLLVFGGSFDPPHFYHTVAPLSVVKRLYGEEGWLLYVPAARSPHKPTGPHASDEHRLAMLRLSLDVPGPRSVWTDEIDRARWQREHGLGGASYTIDTLRRLREVIPSRVSLRLLIGSDQAAAFHQWKDARKIIALAEPLVMAREPIVSACSLFSAINNEIWTLAERRAWCTRLAPNFPMDPSSTAVRDAIPGASKNAERWEKHPRLTEIVTPVATHIIEHNLYGFRSGKTKLARPVARPSGDEPGALRRLEASVGATLISSGLAMLSGDPQKKRLPAKAGGRRKASK